MSGQQTPLVTYDPDWEQRWERANAALQASHAQSGKSIFTNTQPPSLNVRNGSATKLPSSKNQLIPFAPDAPMLAQSNAEKRDDH